MNRTNRIILLKQSAPFLLTLAVSCYLLEDAYRNVVFYDYIGRENLINALIMCMGVSRSGWLGVAFPVMACMPYSCTYVQEYKAGYTGLLLPRMGIATYIRRRLLVNALFGGLALSVPLVLFTGRLAPFLSLDHLYDDVNHSTVASFCTGLAAAHPKAYLALMVLQAFFCGAAFATFGMGVSAWLLNEFLGLALPLALCFFSALVGHAWNLIHVYVPSAAAHVRPRDVIIMGVCLFVAGAGLFITGVFRNEEGIKDYFDSHRRAYHSV